MTTFKHTPGPWRVVKATNSVSEEWTSVRDAKGTIICDDEPYYPHALDPANAHLIAAAPDMLDALKAAKSEFWDNWHAYMSEEQFNSDPTIKQIDAAINKAKGRMT